MLCFFLTIYSHGSLLIVGENVNGQNTLHCTLLSQSCRQGWAVGAVMQYKRWTRPRAGTTREQLYSSYPQISAYLKNGKRLRCRWLLCVTNMSYWTWPMLRIVRLTPRPPPPIPCESLRLTNSSSVCPEFILAV